MSISRRNREELSRIQVSEERRTQEIIKETEMGEKRFFSQDLYVVFQAMYVCLYQLYCSVISDARSSCWWTCVQITQLEFAFLPQVSEEESLAESTAPVSGVVLTLMANLRQCFLTDRLPVDEARQSRSNAYVSLRDRSAMFGGASSQPSPWSQGASSRTLFATSLQIVLKGLIEYILSSRESGSANVDGFFVCLWQPSV